MLFATLPADTRARTYAGAATLKAYRYPKGVSGNPSEMNRYYFECRKLAKEASPEIMRELIQLGLTAEDERVKSVACVAVLDRAISSAASSPRKLRPRSCVN